MQRVALNCLLFWVLVGTGSQANAQSLANPLASIMSLSPTSGQGTCRMETGAAHDFCGLPYELSNFQGGFFGCPAAACAGFQTRSDSLDITATHHHGSTLCPPGLQ
jgi:hypothetical protein